MSSLVDHFEATPVAPLPNSFTDIGQHDLFGLPYIIYVAIIVAIVAYLLLHSTTLGWSIRALGANREAARRSEKCRVRASRFASTCVAGHRRLCRGIGVGPTRGRDSRRGKRPRTNRHRRRNYRRHEHRGRLGTIPGAVLGSLLLSVLATGLILLHVDPTLEGLRHRRCSRRGSGTRRAPSSADVPCVSSTRPRSGNRISDGLCTVGSTQCWQGGSYPWLP